MIDHTKVFEPIFRLINEANISIIWIFVQRKQSCLIHSGIIKNRFNITLLLRIKNEYSIFIENVNDTKNRFEFRNMRFIN